MYREPVYLRECDFRGVYLQGKLTRLFWEEKLQLQPQLPVRSRVWLFYIVVCTCLSVYRLLPDLEDSSGTAPERDGPFVATVCLPICRDNWRRCQIPAVNQVVVYEILSRKQIDILIAGTGKRPDVADQ